MREATNRNIPLLLLGLSPNQPDNPHDEHPSNCFKISRWNLYKQVKKWAPKYGVHFWYSQTQIALKTGKYEANYSENLGNKTTINKMLTSM